MSYFPYKYSAALFGSFLLFAACSSSGDSVQDAPAKTIREQERNFDPSEYRRETVQPKDTTAEQRQTIPEKQPEWIERKEKTMGFRVQLYSTTNIDDARERLEQLRSKTDSLEIITGRLDMGYDAPYYKIRAGDFILKAEAESLREKLRAAGITEAWVVRDNVFKVIRERKK